MIVIILTMSIVYAFILTWLAYTWYKDLKNKEDTDERILQLEKRIQEQHKCFSGTINDFKDTIINLNIEQSDLEKRIQKLERKKKRSKDV